MSEQPFQVQMTTVGLVLWNPTNDDLDMQYAGISLTLKAGEKQGYAIRCATHLLNAYGQRGLTSLTYGCDEEKVKQAAIQRNIEFKKHQILVYNQTQEQRKMTGHLGYQMPTPELKKYSIELGVKLMEPYSFKDEEMAAVAKTSLENEKLKLEIQELKTMMKQFLEKKEEPEPPKSGDGLRERKNGKWVKANGPSVG